MTEVNLILSAEGQRLIAWTRKDLADLQSRLYSYSCGMFRHQNCEQFTRCECRCHAYPMFDPFIDR